MTSAQLNAQLRDNMLETAPAKSTAGSWPQHFAVSATNTIAAREYRNDTVATSESTTLTSFADLPAGTVGPSVTLTTGSFVLVHPAASMVNSSTGVSRASFAVTGTTTSPANDGRGTASQGTSDVRAGSSQLLAVTPGAGNVFTMQYRVSANTGTFADRRIIGIAL